MPPGKVHAAVARPVAAGLTLAGLGFMLIHPPAIALSVGAWVGKYANPDQDHHQITYTERRVIRRNRLLGWLWVLYWTPYQRSRPHRGISHSWPAGTVERFLLVFWPALLASAALVLMVDDGLLVPVLWGWGYVFIGQSIQDLIHIAMDVVSSRLRRRRNRRLRR
jgi:uncharacterized metal-binding protein